MQINILDAKNKLSQLVKSAQAGEDVVIANRGVPVVRLVPTTQAPGPTGKVRGHILEWLAAHPLPEHLRRSHARIERSLHEERAAWD